MSAHFEPMVSPFTGKCIREARERREGRLTFGEIAMRIRTAEKVKPWAGWGLATVQAAPKDSPIKGRHRTSRFI